MEGVERIAWRDFQTKACAGCHVADGKLDSLDYGVPKEENFDRPAQPLGELSSRRRDFAFHESPFL